MLVLSGTSPFRKLLKRVGNVTFHINAAYIGLEWIARGKGIPSGLNIHWPEPKDPRAAIDQSRQMLHTATLGYTVDCLDSYLRLISHIPWLRISQPQRDVLNKAVTRQNGGAYAIWERFSEVIVEPNADSKTDLNMVRMLTAWRNKKAHEGLEDDGDDRLDIEAELALISSESNLTDRYGGLVPREMIEQFKAQHAPRRKEIVGLVSASVNLARFVDNSLLATSIKNERDLERVAIAELAAAFGKHGEAESEIRKLWGKNEAAKTRRFKAMMEECGFTTPDDSPQVSLPDDFKSRVSRLSVGEALSTFGASNDR
jgi:hypothetical protein